MIPTNKPNTIWLVHNDIEGFKVFIVNKAKAILCITPKYINFEKATAKRKRYEMSGFEYLGKLREGDLE